jgi:hypothetical protein
MSKFWNTNSLFFNIEYRDHADAAPSVNNLFEKIT